MENNKNILDNKELALHYMKTLVDVSREAFLILDSNLVVISANPVFYQTFQVSQKQTEAKSLYGLGNGQWNIPKLKKLLEDILPNKKVVKDYEVRHEFETIGQKIMLLNAMQIDSVQLIILAIEDITVRKELEIKLDDYTNELEKKVAEQTEELTDKIKELEKTNKSMVGRELKMAELKKEIEILKRQ
ncbi:MAG: PAS domain-containing protein [bacterium]|nr:PAS domain-containing protein [bacterium]